MADTTFDDLCMPFPLFRAPVSEAIVDEEGPRRSCSVECDDPLLRSLRIAESATGLALGPDGGLLYGTITDDVFSARCAP